MSFGLAELALQTVIQDSLAHLRKNPHHLEFVLNRHCEIPAIAKRVGNNFVKNAMHMILNQELTVRPYFTEDIDQYPCVLLTAAYSEDLKYFGDYGSTGTLSDEGGRENLLQPTIYAEFDVIKVDGDTLRVPAAYRLEEKLFAGLWVTNGKETAKVTGLKPGEHETEIFIDRKLTGHPRLKGWKAQTLACETGAVISASHNEVQVAMNLYTTGDPDLHRVYAQVVRYCLKRGRKILESYGIQAPTFAQQPPAVADSDNRTFMTRFSMVALELDSWIDHEFNPVDRIGVSFDARSIQEETESVPLG